MIPKLGFTANFGDEDGNSFCRRELWGGGQGWMAGALALACRLLPPEDGETKKTLGERLNRLLKAMKNYLREDGRFHDVFGRPVHVPRGDSIPDDVLYCLSGNQRPCGACRGEKGCRPGAGAFRAVCG